MSKAVVLLSGGMDSLITAAIAENECSECYYIHINYGQRTEAKELEAFRKITEFYQPKDTLICDLDFLKNTKSSSLIDKNLSIPLDDTDQLKKEVPNTYVPFRNAVMLAIAVSWAESIEANKVYIGAVEEDSSGYPDCREQFFDSFNDVISKGTKNEKPISIVTPIIHKTKKDIVLLGYSLQAPLELSWSCYRNNTKACGLCASCRLRLKAFKEAGMTDPIDYEEFKR